MKLTNVLTPQVHLKLLALTFFARYITLVRGGTANKEKQTCQIYQKVTTKTDSSQV